jgi:arylsulfatase A-like enzyme
MGDSAVRFLRKSDSRPFCLSVSFKAPHAQDESVARPFLPDRADETLYGRDTFPLPINYSSEAFARLPEFAQSSEGHTRFLRRFADPSSRERNVKDYYRLITGIDREIGRLVETLQELGLSKNTMIVFTSDNGFFLGERGLSDKFLMYEESIRVPMIIFDPAAPRSARGQRRDEMVLNIDVAPTLFDAAGLPVPTEVQGQSLRPLVRGENPPWRTEWFYEHHYAHGGKIPESEGVRTGRWKYIRYTSATPAVEELYDLENDPLETRNLAQDSASADRLAALRLRWIQFRDELR